MLFLAAENTHDPIHHVTDKILVSVGDGMPLITMHMVTIIVVGLLFVGFMMIAAKQIATGAESEGNERYVAKGRIGQFVEAIIVYLRDEMLDPVLGEKDARKYLPFLMTVFFFILANNVFGLIPIVDVLHLFGVHTTWIGGTATGNFAITIALASVAFIMIQVHGFRELGIKHWFLHNFATLVPGPLYLLPVALVVFAVEMAGHFIKPAALAIRLFANMVAGHTLLAVLLSFGLTAAHAAGEITGGVVAISVVSGIASVLVFFLEVFVAFLQAFIFMFLTAVFMSLMSHHDDHDEHEHEHEYEILAAPAPA